MPYLSFAIRQTHVANLHLIGRLFGMRPPECTSCRVLEIGGASGGNLIPMAAALPKSEFVCLDPSVRQVEEGRRNATALGLKNLRFEASPVEKLGREAQFDYIICHGVFSWVPPPVQEAIFGALKRTLPPNGIAIVSYKALPGWHAHRALREVLQRHCAGERGQVAKARLAREMLDLLAKGAHDPRSAWGPLLLAEIERLRAGSDEFLLHDTLEDHNEAFYFSDFMARARQHGLQYLGDADLPTMYVANATPCIPPAVARGDDVEAMEQYIDFGLNRLFRQTLLCRDSVSLQRGLALDAVDACYIQSSLMPEAPATFRAASGIAMSTTDPVVAEVLATLARHASLPVSAEVALAEVRGRLPDRDPEAVRASLRRTVMQGFFAGGIELYSLPPAHVASVSTRPMAGAAARHEAKFRSVVTNARHEAIVLTPFEQALLQSLDGQRAAEDLGRELGDGVSEALKRFAGMALLYG